MTANTADISGISVSSSDAWAPDMTSAPRLKPVTMMIAASAAKVARIPQTRHPYTRNRLIQIKWKGTVAHPRNIRIPATLTRTKIHQPISTWYRRHPEATRSAKVNPVAHAADGRDHVRFQLRPQPPPHGPGPGVRLLADRVEHHLGGGENVRVRQAPVPDPRLDPGQQLIKHERLGQRSEERR